MDCYKTESEFIDSLDFLSPPVKRISSRDLFGCSYNDEPNDIRLFRGIRKKFALKEKSEPKKEKEQLKKDRKTAQTAGGSSTSLVLKKTSERKILQRYSVVSYTSLHSANITPPGKTNKRVESKGKPLIKVTVIRKNDQVQTANLLRKRRSVPKKVQSTSSNQENSVKTKNLYVVVAGRKNKIYEIKTTGSATFSCEQTESNYTKNDISVERLSHVKHLLQSLNMDTKKKKDKKENKIDDIQKASFSNNRKDPDVYASKGIDPYEYERYTNSNNLESEQKPLNRSRIRIYGQLGLTDDDRYVLRYGATVNDKRVTDFAQLTQDFLPQVLPPSIGIPNQYETSPEVTKEVSVQATNYDAYYRNQHPTVSNFVYSKESQGTQVNFNNPVAPKNYTNALRIDKDVQCSCNYVVEHKPVDNKYELSTLKDGQSPLVIISVYPKQSPQEMVKYSTDRYPKTPVDSRAQYVPKLQADKGTNKKASQTKVEQNSNKKNVPVNKNTNKKPPNNRSLSPLKNVSKGKLQNKDNETIVLKTQTNATPDRFKAMRAIKNKILEKDRNKPEGPNTSKVNRPNAIPVQRSRSPMRRYSPTRSQEKGTNTEHAKAKKNLVDNYTRQLTDKMNYKDTIPAKLDNSRVTINIEGEQENYNVWFDQNQISTDLRINKTMKHKNSHKSKNRVTSPSLENLTLPEKGPQVKSMSVPFCDQQSDENGTNKRVSGIAVRDSLEISHRRENKQGSGAARTRTYIPGYSIDGLTNSPESIAPIKHYTGDDCSICDPVERDKEIRELLGVKKSNCVASNSLQARLMNEKCREYPLPLQCFYRAECEKKRMAEVNLVKYCSIIGSLAKTGKKAHYPKTHCCNDLVKDQLCCGRDYNADEEVGVCSKQISKRAACPTGQASIDKQIQTVAHNTENSAIYQQLILNRNIQIFLQVEQFSKQRPIILSRKQYDKVKRIIQTNINRKCRCKKQENVGSSDVYVGKVRPKINLNTPLHFDQQIQTEWEWGKNSFQKSSKRPRMVSKVKYLIRPSISKCNRQTLLDNGEKEEIPTFEEIDRYYELYPQKDSNGNIEVITPCPQTHKYFKPNEEYSEIQQRNSTNNDRSNELTEIKRECEYIPCITLVNKKYIEHGQCIGKQHNFVDKQRKKLNENTKLNEQRYENGNGEHGMLVNDYGYDDHGACREMDDIKLIKQNKEYIKEIKEFPTFVPKYCADCGKYYRPNKECCKEIGKKNINDNSHKNTEQIETNKVSTDIRESGKSYKKCKEIEEIYTAGPRKITKEDHAIGDGRRKKTESYIVHSRENVVSNNIRHTGCGEHSTHSPESRPINHQHTKPVKSNEIHSFYGHQNTDIHKSNTVRENRVAKLDQYGPSNDRKSRSTGHKSVNTCASVSESHEKRPDAHVNNVATLEKHNPIEVSRLKRDKYQKRRKESDHDLRIHETYFGINEKFQDYFKNSVKVDEYFGKNLEYCRLNVEHFTNTHTEDHTKNDRCIETNDLRSEYQVERDHQIELEQQIKALALHDDEREQKQDSLQVNHSDQSIKNTVSSLEIRYTSVAYSKKIDLASSDVAVCSDSSICHVNSIQTIFRGRRKSPTPNLGTSVCSMCSEDGLQSNKSTKFIMAPHDVKPNNKRPFLRRLISCLVMRSERASELRLPISPAKEIPSINSSVDSYHISTSLGAVEVTSSIYDTSASFYSNHTILPTNSKIKRGFFNSVRGFLTNRRS